MTQQAVRVGVEQALAADRRAAEEAQAYAAGAIRVQPSSAYPPRTGFEAYVQDRYVNRSRINDADKAGGGLSTGGLSSGSTPVGPGRMLHHGEKLPFDEQRFLTRCREEYERMTPADQRWWDGRAIQADVSQPVAASSSGRTVESYQREMVSKHPALGVAGSPLNQEFIARVNRYRLTNPAVFDRVDWPVRLARESVAALAAGTPTAATP